MRNRGGLPIAAASGAIAIGISATPIFVRLTRAQVINVKVEDYVEAAREAQDWIARQEPGDLFGAAR